MIASTPTTVFFIFHRDGSIERKVKEPLSKISFTNELGNLYKRCRATKKTKK